jgi:TM2 domain-containing membrane protein YozV
MSVQLPSAIASTGAVSQDAKALMLYEANKKAALVAYLFWFFLGGFGAHRFYLGRTGGGVGQLLLLILGLLTAALGIGMLFLVVLGIWVIVDAFLIPGWITVHNTNLARGLAG